MIVVTQVLNEERLSARSSDFSSSYRCSKLGQHGYYSVICDYCQIFFIFRYVSNGSTNTRQDLKNVKVHIEINDLAFSVKGAGVVRGIPRILFARSVRSKHFHGVFPFLVRGWGGIFLLFDRSQFFALGLTCPHWNLRKHLPRRLFGRVKTFFSRKLSLCAISTPLLHLRWFHRDKVEWYI